MAGTWRQAPLRFAISTDIGCTFELRDARSDWISVSGQASISFGAARDVFTRFVLEPRPKWVIPPAGFGNRDWEPWRFRRRLSVLRRPFLQLDQSADAQIMLAPGILHDALLYTLNLYHQGNVHQAEIESAEMQSWIGHVSNENGTRFSSSVREKLRSLGWETRLEVQMTNILSRRHDPHFGDLKRFGDVDVLAWRKGSTRVLAMECKDLQFMKTPGEIAEQLSDFRGQTRPTGKPDLLKRHLDRIEVLKMNSEGVAKGLKLQTPIQIEGHLVFRNPVPMKFAWDRMASIVRLSLYDELDRL